MRIENVIFLGAGASAADGAPLQKELFKTYFEEENFHDQDLHPFFTQFFKDLFGIDTAKVTSETQFPTFEEILGILELAISRNESLKNYPIGPDNPKIQLSREKIIFLIARILERELRGRRTNHDSLVRHLLSKKLIRKTAFISLNYDILIDNAITDVYDHVDLDYGVRFTNFERTNDWWEPKKSKSVLLLKLHGSLNWLYCPTCISLTITPKEKRASTLIERKEVCDKCHSFKVPIVIPPTFFKVMSNYFLQQIWRKAEAALMETKRIIFCGYSFPDADIHIKYLLKRIEINRGSTPEIFVINNHMGKSDEDRKEEEHRYKRFFADKKKVHYLTRSFKDLCDNGIQATLT